MTDELMSGELEHLRACEHAIVEVRDIALGQPGDPLFEKWLGGTVSSPLEIPGLVKDRMAEREHLRTALKSIGAELGALYGKEWWLQTTLSNTVATVTAIINEALDAPPDGE